MSLAAERAERGGKMVSSLLGRLDRDSPQDKAYLLALGLPGLRIRPLRAEEWGLGEGDGDCWRLGELRSSS